jgi:hypothetical protein
VEAGAGMSKFRMGLVRVAYRSYWAVLSVLLMTVISCCDEPIGVPNPILAAVADLCHLSGYRSLLCTV